jgi:Ca2+/H+ antiporter, TMEM165/GDT1 family
MYKKFWIKKVIGFTVMAAAFGSLLSYVVMRLWNGILTEVVHVSPISFLQAIGILVLSKILFGGFHGRWGCGPRHHWKNEMKEKWHNMSPEEREKMKEEWRNKCRTWRKPNSQPAANEQ